ncbi:MAG: restriction endonuclease subunit S [Bacteroidetes bacterium HGW-Bacteroidetes-16]|jgi:type I restriction enzyme S subunit|nr:MAG: restriction endonuclease subunit S [Bacteroidetes bacterium HGW-Bacteroidetes-16]
MEQNRSLTTNLPKGYKHTEIGVIPEEWEVVILSRIVDFLDGQRRPIKSGNRIKGEYPYYGASGVIDYVDDYIFNDELILLGEDGENILSRNLPLAFQVKGKIWVNNHAHVLKPTSDVNITFLTEYLESLDYSLLNSGTAQPKLNKQACINILVNLPSLPEQKAIAQVLSDTDNLIHALEKQITKKRLIKQGAMQELLRPKKGWKVKKLGEIAEVRDGTHQTPTYVKIGIPFYSVESVTNNDFINTKYITREAHKSLTKKFRIERGDILMTRIGSIGDCKLIDWEVNASFYVSLALLKIKPGYSQSYICHYSKTSNFRKEAELNSLQSAIPKKINLGPISNIIIEMPDYEEQTRIAAILSDMDKEIEALEKKLAKYQQLKQGLMQNLLTGKIRLVSH